MAKKTAPLKQDALMLKHIEAIDKIRKVVQSCETMEQLNNAVKLIYNNYNILRGGPARFAFISILDLPLKQSKVIVDRLRNIHNYAGTRL